MRRAFRAQWDLALNNRSRTLAAGRRPVQFRLAALLCVWAMVWLTVFPGAAASKPARPGGLPVDYSLSSAVCDLLTKADLQVILGHRYLNGTNKALYDKQLNKRSGVPGGFSLPVFPEVVGTTTCMYASPDSNLAFAATGVAASLAPYVWKQVNKGTAVAGLGDQAVWQGDKGKLLVLKGGKIFTLFFQKEPSDTLRQNRERATRLARKALGRLR